MSALILPGRPAATAPGGLPAIFRQACTACPIPGGFDLSSPWREGPIVYATDGALVAWVSTKHLPPSAYEHLPQSGPTRPADMGRRMAGAGPFEDAATPWPTRIKVPDCRPPECLACHGSGQVRPLVILGGFTDLRPCGDCGGSGRLPRTGVCVELLPAEGPFPMLGLDRWYVTLLRGHDARLYAPRRDPAVPNRVGPWRFAIGPVTGFVQPMVPSMARVLRDGHAHHVVGPDRLPRNPSDPRA